MPGVEFVGWWGQGRVWYGVCGSIRCERWLEWPVSKGPGGIGIPAESELWCVGSGSNGSCLLHGISVALTMFWDGVRVVPRAIRGGRL